MKKCTFCGCQTDNKTVHCASCGSKEFVYVCPNCSAEYEGLYCPKCGVRRDASAKVCPKCTVKYYTKFCPNCGYNPAVESNTGSGSVQGTSAGYRRFSYGRDPGFSALILSVISILLMMFPLAIVSLIMGYNLKKTGQYTPIVRASIIISIIELLLTVLTTLIYVIFFVLVNTGKVG